MKQKKESLGMQFGKYVSLNIFGMIGISCYILMDTFFVAKGLGADGLTALNLAIPIYSFIHGLGLMIGMGSATRYSILQGEKDEKRGNHVFSQAVIFTALLSVVTALIGVLLSGHLSTVLGASEDIHSMTMIYIKVILLFSPFFMMNNVLICFVRNDNNPKLAMIGMVLGSLANIVLDYVFIFPFGMGMFGAVLATGISPVISIMVLSLHFLQRKASFTFVKSKLTFERIKDMSALGSASFIAELSSGIVMIVFNSIILSLHGNLGVAAYAVVANVALVVIAVFNGTGQGMQPLLSTNYGEQNKEGIKSIFRMGIITAFALAVGVYGIIFLGAERIVTIFNSDNNLELAQMGAKGLRLYFTAFFFMGLNVILTTYFSSCDQPVKSFMISILRGFLIIVPVIFVLSSFFQMNGVWMALTVTEGIVLCISFLLYKKVPEKK